MPDAKQRRIRIIFRKELAEIFRDRRTVISVVVSPLIITPALFALMSLMAVGQSQKVRTRTYNVGVAGAENAPEIARLLDKASNLRVAETPRDRAEPEIKRHELDAVAVIPAGAADNLRRGSTVDIDVLEDAGNETSQAAASRLVARLSSIENGIVAARLRERRLPAGYASPLRVEEKPIHSGGTMGTMLLAMMLPYILAVAAFSGGVYAAFDQVAGEKERGTLETLLVSPASRRDIVLGKFSAVVTVCIISSVLAVLGMTVSMSANVGAFNWLSRGGVHISAPAVFVTLAVMLPLSVLFAGILLALSTFARNQKEAQTYLAPLFTLVLVPSMASMFIGAEVPRSIALAPVLNASVIVKQALSGTYDWTFILIAFAASAVYAGIALSIATALFEKESVLIKA